MQPWMSLRRVLCHGRWIGKRFRRASWRERRCLTRRVFVRDPTDSGWTSEIGYSKAVQRSAILINNSPKSHTTCLLPKREQRPTNSNKKDRHPPTNMPPNILHHQTPAGAQKWDALLTCTVTSLVLNACLHYTLSISTTLLLSSIRLRGTSVYFCLLDQTIPVAHWRRVLQSFAQSCGYVSGANAGGELVAMRLEIL
jgi:hypothetical protein